MHNVSQWPNLRHLGELLGEPKACWKQWVLRRQRKVWVEEVTNAKWEWVPDYGSCNTETADEEVVRKRGTDNRLAFAERRERVGYGNSKGNVGKQAEWSRVLWVSVASLNFMHCSTNPTLPSQTASGSNQPFCHSTLSRQTDRPTHRPIDGIDVSSIIHDRLSSLLLIESDMLKTKECSMHIENGK